MPVTAAPDAASAVMAWLPPLVRPLTGDRAQLVPSAEVQTAAAVAAGPSSFVSAGTHDNRPVVGTSSDGRTWTAVSTPLPAGASAGVIQQVAVNGSHVVALGQQTTADGIQPLAERSDDGGRTWQPVPFSAPGPGVSFTALAASGTAVTGIDSIQTQASQQFVVLRLPSG